jgi:hypothetical protein
MAETDLSDATGGEERPRKWHAHFNGVTRKRLVVERILNVEPIILSLTDIPKIRRAIDGINQRCPQQCPDSHANDIAAKQCLASTTRDDQRKQRGNTGQ